MCKQLSFHLKVFLPTDGETHSIDNETEAIQNKAVTRSQIQRTILINELNAK